jgi:hypothetical protein
LDTSELAQACYAEIISLLENPNPEVFSELRVAQQQLYIQCHHLLKAFVEAGVPPNELPTLPTQLSAGHVNGTADLFDVNFAENLVSLAHNINYLNSDECTRTHTHTHTHTLGQC